MSAAATPASFALGLDFGTESGRAVLVDVRTYPTKVEEDTVFIELP